MARRRGMASPSAAAVVLLVLLLRQAVEGCLDRPAWLRPIVERARDDWHQLFWRRNVKKIRKSVNLCEFIPRLRNLCEFM
jgi:hypothetical protein